jgi:hypothetical protein
MISIGACKDNDFVLSSGSGATCGASATDVSVVCNIVGALGVRKLFTKTGNYVVSEVTTQDNADSCDDDAMAALVIIRAMTGGIVLDAEIGGKTYGPGFYAGGATNVAADTFATLDAGGDPSAVFIFQGSTTLILNANSKIVLTGGAKAENVFWGLGTALTMAEDAEMVGIVLALTAVTIGKNGKLLGRALAETAVTCPLGCTITSPA